MKLDRECLTSQVKVEQAHAVKIYDLEDADMAKKEPGIAMPWMVWHEVHQQSARYHAISNNSRFRIIIMSGVDHNAALDLSKRGSSPLDQMMIYLNETFSSTPSPSTWKELIIVSISDVLATEVQFATNQT